MSGIFPTAAERAQIFAELRDAAQQLAASRAGLPPLDHDTAPVFFGRVTAWECVERLGECLPQGSVIIERVRYSQARTAIALNDGSLVDYLNSLSWNAQLTSSFYDKGSFLREDDEVVEATQALDVLRGVRFALPDVGSRIDRPTLWEALDLLDAVWKAVRAVQAAAGPAQPLRESDAETSRLLVALSDAIGSGLRVRGESAEALLRVAGKLERKLGAAERLSADAASNEKLTYTWIKQFLNEASLQDFVQELLANREMLEMYYSEDAFLRDSDCSQGFLSALPPLSRITFELAPIQAPVAERKPRKTRKTKVVRVAEADDGHSVPQSAPVPAAAGLRRTRHDFGSNVWNVSSSQRGVEADTRPSDVPPTRSEAVSSGSVASENVAQSLPSAFMMEQSGLTMTEVADPPAVDAAPEQHPAGAEPQAAKNKDESPAPVVSEPPVSQSPESPVGSQSEGEGSSFGSDTERIAFAGSVMSPPPASVASAVAPVSSEAAKAGPDSDDETQSGSLSDAFTRPRSNSGEGIKSPRSTLAQSTMIPEEQPRVKTSRSLSDANKHMPLIEYYNAGGRGPAVVTRFGPLRIIDDYERDDLKALPGAAIVRTVCKDSSDDIPLSLTAHTKFGFINKGKVSCPDCGIVLSSGAKNRFFDVVRYCHYTGKWYCEDCHKNDRSVIPARVIFDWDLSEYKVAQSSLEQINKHKNDPVLNIPALNVKLFSAVPGLKQASDLRKQIYGLGEFVESCKNRDALIAILGRRSHFLQSAVLYSLQDLIDVNDGLLVPFLLSAMEKLLVHITKTCHTCRGKGFFCEYCNKEPLVFSFQVDSVRCTNCKTVYHLKCAAEHNFSPATCPKCIRIAKIRRQHADLPQDDQQQQQQ
eukprot:m51a1_g6706 hypothetical protein (872) ;mRNA; r:110428-114461